jgi:hypothetical protein
MTDRGLPGFTNGIKSTARFEFDFLLFFGVRD